MIHKSRPRSSNLFLMELILAILFFTAASAICLQFFVKSHLLSRESHALNQAVTVCSSLAEFIQVSEDPEATMELLRKEYPSGIFTDMELILYYDGDFAICNSHEAVYQLKLRLMEEESMLEARMEVTSPSSGERETKANSEPLYELTVLHHPARRTTYE